MKIRSLNIKILLTQKSNQEAKNLDHIDQNFPLHPNLIMTSIDTRKGESRSTRKKIQVMKQNPTGRRGMNSSE